VAQVLRNLLCPSTQVDQQRRVGVPQRVHRDFFSILACFSADASP
jgi:hypothetical protein